VKLSDYDLIIVEISGGKDSMVMLHRLSREHDVIALHASLPGFEWPGLGDWARRQAQWLDAAFVGCRHPKTIYQRVRERRLWPSPACRWCTSDLKVGPCCSAVRRIARERGASRVLVCKGERAEESPARARKPVLSADELLTIPGRQVDVWRPIHDMTEGDVWRYTAVHDLPVHRAYGYGFQRLGCPYCIYADEAQRALANSINELEPLRREIGEVEAEVGHTLYYSPASSSPDPCKVGAEDDQ
jgi:3'-phosphoadenosine 5'-phosphosulfate sulfotransferase (PAPS reductase)/FAD synthetase